MQQVTCRTSPTGECGKLIAVPNRGRASRWEHCYLIVSNFCTFWKYASKTKLCSKWYAASFRKFWIDSNLFLFSNRFYGIVLTCDEEKATAWWTILQKNIEKKKQSWELKNLRASRGNLRQTNIPFFWPISFTFSVSGSKSRERLNDTNQQKELPNDTFVIYANRICIKKNGGLCETHKHVQYWYALLRLIKLLQSNFDSPKVSEILNC